MYSFYLRDCNTKPAPTMYGNLISGATSKIIIWDPYIHHQDISVFSQLTCAVDIVLLTLMGAQKWSNWQTGIINEFRQMVPTAFLDETSLTLAYIDKAQHGDDLNGKWQFHDRFLIIDDMDYYLVGSSIAHHLSAKQSTGIMKLEHDVDKALIYDVFSKTFDQAVFDNCLITLPNLR